MSYLRVGSVYKFSDMLKKTYGNGTVDMTIYEPNLRALEGPGFQTVDAEIASFLCVKKVIDPFGDLRAILLVRSISGDTFEVSVDDKRGQEFYTEIVK